MFKILLDSCIWSGARQVLEDAGYDCKWVGDFLKDPGDQAIMEIAVKENRIIITQDKDFGELAIFRNVPHHGIIRLVAFRSLLQGEVSLSVLRNYRADLERKAIITIDKNKVRVRLID